MTLFGASYATVSLSCTLPIFLTAVTGSFRDGNVLGGLATYVAYAARHGAGHRRAHRRPRPRPRRRRPPAPRRAAPPQPRRPAACSSSAGAYVAYYGYFEIRTLRGDTVPAGPVDLGHRLVRRPQRPTRRDRCGHTGRRPGGARRRRRASPIDGAERTPPCVDAGGRRRPGPGRHRRPNGRRPPTRTVPSEAIERHGHPPHPAPDAPPACRQPRWRWPLRWQPGSASGPPRRVAMHAAPAPEPRPPLTPAASPGATVDPGTEHPHRPARQPPARGRGDRRRAPGETVALADLLPADKPTLVWMWAPH